MLGTVFGARGIEENDIKSPHVLGAYRQWWETLSIWEQIKQIIINCDRCYLKEPNCCLRQTGNHRFSPKR